MSGRSPDMSRTADCREFQRGGAGAARGSGCFSALPVPSVVGLTGSGPSNRFASGTNPCYGGFNPRGSNGPRIWVIVHPKMPKTTSLSTIETECTSTTWCNRSGTSIYIYLNYKTSFYQPYHPISSRTMSGI